MDEQLASHVLAAGMAALPNEACGLLVQFKDHVGMVPITNAHAEPWHAYTFDPHEQVREWFRHNVNIVGVYHTHPTTGAYPSGSDVTGALPHFVYVIGSMHTHEVRAYRIQGNAVTDVTEEWPL
jgi:proteasome lid subunit RPN8/RPN11